MWKFFGFMKALPGSSDDDEMSIMISSHRLTYSTTSVGPSQLCRAHTLSKACMDENMKMATNPEAMSRRFRAMSMGADGVDSGEHSAGPVSGQFQCRKCTKPAHVSGIDIETSARCDRCSVWCVTNDPRPLIDDIERPPHRLEFSSRSDSHPSYFDDSR